jgi:exodeoxyribonuclease VIII
MADKIAPPEPGVYQGIAFDTYRAWDALNISTLLWATCSMEHVKACLDGVIEDTVTDAKQFGSALHCRVLEPDEFAVRYAIVPGCQAKLKSGKNAGEDCGARASYRTADGLYMCGKHAPPDAEEPDNIITPEQHARLEAINAKVRAHPVVKLIRQHGGFECSIVWERSGILCKARLDKWITGAKCPDTVLDLKKVQLGGASDEAFSRAIKNYHYHMKAAWYADAAKSMNGIDPVFVWLAVEEKPPYGVNVMCCDADTMQIGRYMNEQVFERYRLCLEKGEWPGYCNDIHLGGLPDYEKRNFQGLLQAEAI